MTVPWSTTWLRADAFATSFVPSQDVPLKVFRTCLPLVTIVGLGAIVWRSRRDGGGMRRCIEVTVEMVRCHRPWGFTR